MNKEYLTKDEAKTIFYGLLFGVIFTIIWVCILGQGQFIPSPEAFLGGRI